MGLLTPEPEKTGHGAPDAAHARSRNRSRNYLVVSAVAALVAVGALMLRESPSPINIELSVEATRDHSGVTVSGETSLADGSIIEIWFVGTGHVPDGEPAAEVSVSDGRFSLTVTAIDEHTQYAVLVFEPVRVAGPQNSSVLSTYGVFGEQLGGPHVVQTDRGNRIEYRIRLPQTS